jgi:hypothetical protein
MRLASRFTAGFALAITVCWALALALSGSTDALLFLAPALLIVAPLVAGHYVGEELIARFAAKRTRRPRRFSTAQSPAPRQPAVPAPHGTRLIAFSLAKRPPPGSLLPQT